MERYINERIVILTSLHVWKLLSESERQRFISCKTEIQVDNLMHDFRLKYIQ